MNGEHVPGSLKSAWRGGLAYETLRSAAAFAILILVAFVACLVWPALREQAISQMLDTIESLDVQTADGALSALGLFTNNVRACIVTMIYGLFPLLQLPALALGMNAMILGILAAWYLSQGFPMLGYLAGLLPHGIFELPALILSFAVGLYICGQLTRRCRGDKTALGFWDCLSLLGQATLLLLPLLAVAAVMEAYVTPVFAALFF